MTLLNDQRKSETVAVWFVGFADLGSVLFEPVQQWLTALIQAPGNTSLESRAGLFIKGKAVLNAHVDLIFGRLTGVRVTFQGNEAQGKDETEKCKNRKKRTRLQVDLLQDFGNAHESCHVGRFIYIRERGVNSTMRIGKMEKLWLSPIASEELARRAEWEKMAERERFELSNGVTHYTRSRRAPSATRPPLRIRTTKSSPNLASTHCVRQTLKSERPSYFAIRSPQSRGLAIVS
jgi:hypothetical protein